MLPFPSVGVGLCLLISWLFAASLQADSLQGASIRNPAVPPPSGGNGDSVGAKISRDGRFVLFSSSANNLTPNGNSQMGLNVFLYDRASDTLALVSANAAGAGGGNSPSYAGQVSTNGRYAVFASDASDLLGGDSNGVTDVFVRDLQAGTNRLVSVAADGGWGNGASTDPAITPDGRYVAFVSAASNLVADDTNGIPDVFVRDLASNFTYLVSAGATGTNVTISAPVITPDGRWVAFSSTAQGLVAGLAPATNAQVYVRDLVAGVTLWASTNAANLASNLLGLVSAASYHPVISDDGRYLGYKTGSAYQNLGTASGNAGSMLVFQYDSVAGTTALVATNGYAPWYQNDDITGPEMSPDGRYLVFSATNHSAGCVEVELWDSTLGTNWVVSVAEDDSLPTNSVSDTPSVSDDGRYVTFLSNATNLTTAPVSNGYHVYRRDRQAGVTALVDVDTNGVGSSLLANTIPTLSADGQFVTFEAWDGNLVSGDNNQAFDVFLSDLGANTISLVSQSEPALIPQTGNGPSWLGSHALSDDGRKLVFTSYASDLAPNDTNNTSDVFVFDTATGTNSLVSAGLDGNPAAGSSFSPAIDLSGRFVVFVSTATNLTLGTIGTNANVYVRDLQAGTNLMVSVTTNGQTAGNGDSIDPVISENGACVAFLSLAYNLGSGGSPAFVYFRNLATGRLTLLGSEATTNSPISISADGRYVAYCTTPQQLIVWDTVKNASAYTSSSSPLVAAVSPTGSRLLFNTAKALSVIDLQSKSNLFTFPAATKLSAGPVWDTAGRFFVFVTATNAVPADTNGTNNVYLYDLSANALTLVSTVVGGTNPASGPSDSPAISGDGRFVTYRSFATNLVANTVNPPPNIYLYDRYTGSNRLVTALPAGSSWCHWNSLPQINGDGSRVICQSCNPALAANDLNRAQDVIADTHAPWGTTDSDGDGIPDLWMMYYFGHPTGEASDLSLAQDDADGNGMSNLEKYLAGLDPLDPAACLTLQITNDAALPPNFTLNWPTVPGKDYTLQFENRLETTNWSTANGASVFGLQGTFSAPVGPSNCFYRVMVK